MCFDTLEAQNIQQFSLPHGEWVSPKYIWKEMEAVLH